MKKINARSSFVLFRWGGRLQSATVSPHAAFAESQQPTSHYSQATAAVAAFFHPWLLSHSPQSFLFMPVLCDGSLEASLIPRSGPRVTAVPPRQSWVPQQRSREASGTGHGRGRPLPAARGNCTRLLRAGRQISCPRLSREVLISSVKNT